MSIGHRGGPAEEIDEAPIELLHEILGEGDTPKLFAQGYKLDTSRTIPMGGGSSIDRRTLYIDAILYQEVMDGKYAETGLKPFQIIERWLDHEHTELVIICGDNSIDTYPPGHKCALTVEHRGVLAILGARSDPKGKIEQYEEVIWPGLLRCYHRPVTNPPKDVWCGPHLDFATPRDQEILEEMRKHDVRDAFLNSRYDSHYGFGRRCCSECTMWSPQEMSQENGRLAACTAVSGLVRDTRWCEWFHARKERAG